MPTPTPDQLDAATIDLIFALRDSLTSDGPSLIDFWGDRATTAIATAAAGSDTAGQAITTACRKLQIDTLAANAAPVARRAAEIIDADYAAWARHVDQSLVYIVALARLERDNRKRGKKPTTPTAPTPAPTSDSSEEIPF